DAGEYAVGARDQVAGVELVDRDGGHAGQVQPFGPQVLGQRGPDDPGHVGRVEPRGYDGIHCRWFHARSHARLNDPSGRNAPRRWPRQASSVSGKSSRQWAPRVSVRAYAAATTAVATVSRLAYSHAAVPAPGGPARRTSSAAARSRVSAL